MRNRNQYRLAALIVALATAAGAVQAQDVQTILKKPTLSAQDRGVLEAEIGQRAKRMFGAPATLNIVDARTKLVAPAKEKEVSKAGLEAYGEIIAGELDRFVGEQDFNVAFTATLVLEELDAAKTVDSLVGALKSPHAGVRYAAARALRSLGPKFISDQSTCANVLSALGRTGAEERDEQVLRRIYEAINLKATGPNFKYDDLAAAALNEVFASRVALLSAGSRDEYRDEAGYAAAAACYADAALARQSAMIDAMYAFLRFSLDHYLDPDLASEAAPILAKRIQRLERTIHDMIRASKASPPNRVIGDMLKSGLSDRKKQEKAVQAALDELRAVLKGEPWKLP